MKKAKFSLINIIVISAMIFSSVPCYAEGQYVAESFGLYSKGVEYYRSGKLYDAKDILERSVSLDSKNDEAQGYLDLVNAELDMRAKGKFNSFRSVDDFERESDFEQNKRYAEIEPDYYTDYEQEEEYASDERGQPLQITGEIQLGIGVTSQDIIWKDANADKVGVPFEKSWRYLWGQDRHNTYDAKIYDRLRVNIDTAKDTGFNAYTEIVIDPWTFVGTKDVSVASTAGGDRVDMTLKYWSNSRSTLNEIYRSEKGNIINLNEIKIVDGETTANRPTGLTDWATNFDPIPTGTDIDWQYMPIRKLWVDYVNEDETFNSRVFLIGDQAQALTSDDPLTLSNNHVYWEESPWLDAYEPSRIFYPDSGDLPVKKGRWIRSLSFVSRDSDTQRLAFLRGVSLSGDFLDNSSYDMTVATPMSLWDDYENVTSTPAAFRTKTDVTDDLTIGSIYTFKGGMNQGSVEAQNHVLGFDAAYDITSDWQAFAEIAGSKTSVDEANGMETSYDGFAYGLGFKSEPFKTKISLKYMAQDFYPGLSNYRYTRRDQFYSKHIRFSELYEGDEAIAIGDGVDRGRVVLGLETSKEFPEHALDAKANFRNVHKDNGKYVETVARMETTYKKIPKLTLKGLAMYQHLPDTIAGYDSLIYAKTSYGFTDYYSEDDTFLENSDIVDGEDPSVGNFAFGVRYDFTDSLAWESVYERTNDPSDCPRGLLNDSYVTTETKDGMLLDKMVPFLYDQGFFDLPPYDYYDIYKTKLIFKPIAKLTGILSFTRNVNEHTIGLDDNVNHFGLEMDYKYSSKLMFGFKYIYSKMIDVYKQTQGEGVQYDGHHNIFAQMDYIIDEDQKFSLLFGEYVAYTPIQDLEAPAKWSLSALDTQHIVRMYYNRKF